MADGTGFRDSPDRGELARGEQARERRTLIVDTTRAGFDGITATLIQTAILLIAIKFFHVSDMEKGLIASAPAMGNLLSLFYTASAARKKKSILVAVPTFLSGLGFLAASMMIEGWIFVLLVSLATAIHIMRLPFLTAIYEENYRTSHRGKLYSVGLILSTLVAIGTNFLFGSLLESRLENFRPILAASGILIAVSALVILAIPSSVPKLSSEGESRNPFRNLSVIRANPVFGYMLSIWFVFGFAVLWTNPLRMVYLAEAERGLNLSPFTVLLIMGVIPAFARLASTWFWAHLFDRVDFVFLRTAMSSLIGAGLLLFFVSPNVYLIAVSSLVYNLGLAGSRLAAMLWVTKIAPPGKSQIYMSVHTFFSGIRGIAAPYLAFLSVRFLTVPTSGLLATGFVVLSVFMILPLFRADRRF